MSSELATTTSPGALPAIRLGETTLSYGHPHDLLGIVEVYVLDAYRIGLLRSGDFVLDVGAGIGDFAVHASRRVGPDGLVVAVEPSPKDFELMLVNLRTNHCANVLPFNCAVGRGPGVVELMFKGESYRSQIRPLAELVHEVSRDAIPRAGLGPTIVKMDVEGSEVAALEGLGELVSTVRAVSIELHQTEPAVSSLLQHHGFRFEPLTRTHYLKSAAQFAARHPLVASRIWRLLGAEGERPPLSKMLTGIELVSGKTLRVGAFVRASGPLKASG